MIVLTILAAATFLTVARAQTATPLMISDHALDCGAAADKAVAATNGHLLSVRPSAGECVISILRRGDSGRPHKVIIRVDPRASARDPDRNGARRSR